MLIGILGFLAAALGTAGGIAEVGQFVYDHPVGSMAVGSQEWKTACALAFPGSFDPDRGTWRDKRGLHPCVCNKLGKCGSHWK